MHRYFPSGLQVSASGKVWTLTMDGFSRWDDSAWRHFNVNDFGARTFMGTFALDGEQVWAPIQEGVLNWDGETWEVHDEVLTEPGASIVAGGGEVWILDRDGKLSHYKEHEWSSQIWTNHPTTGRPQLVRTADGGLWAVWKGIWRFDGANWAPAEAQGRRREQWRPAEGATATGLKKGNQDVVPFTTGRALDTGKATGSKRILNIRAVQAREQAGVLGNEAGSFVLRSIAIGVRRVSVSG